MFEITDQARTELHRMLLDMLDRRDDDEPSALGFRLVLADDPSDGMGLGLTLDAVREGDEIFAHEGTHILMIDGAARGLVDDLVLDVAETPIGRRLRLRRMRGALFS